MNTTPIPVGTPVDVYWNLHKHVFSVRSRAGETRGRVIGHADSFTLSNVQFVVNQAGRQKVLKEKRKNVHAFVRGYWAEPESHSHFIGNLSRVKYNPYAAGHFTGYGPFDTSFPVDRSDAAHGQIQHNSPVLFGYWK